MSDHPASSPEQEALDACSLAGKHLLNVLTAIGVQPDEIATQAEALDRRWPTDWAYDAWSAWHACRVALRRAGRDVEEISRDRRAKWRTRANFADHPARGKPN